MNIKTILASVAPFGAKLAQSAQAEISASGADTVAQDQLNFLRVLAVGAPEVTDHDGVLLMSDHYSGGLADASKAQRKKVIDAGLFQEAYESIGAFFEEIGAPDKRHKAMFGVMLAIAQVLRDGSKTQIQAVVDSFRFGPTDDSEPTFKNVERVARTQVDAMMHDLQISSTNKEGVVTSVATYFQAIEAHAEIQEQVSVLAKAKSQARRDLVKVFNADRQYMIDGRTREKEQREQDKEQYGNATASAMSAIRTGRADAQAIYEELIASGHVTETVA
jgi:hypothetical protein